MEEISAVMHGPYASETRRSARQAVDGLLLAPPLERRRLQCYLAMILGDMIAFVAGFAIVGYLYVGTSGGADALMRSQIAIPIFLTVALYNGSYSMASLINAWIGIYRAIIALAIAATAGIFLAFVVKISEDF